MAERKFHSYARLSKNVSIPMAGSNITGVPAPNEVIEVNVFVRRDPASKPLPSPEEIGLLMPRERKHLTHADFETTYGASAEDLKQVEAFARECGLNVVAISAAKRKLTLSGTIATISAAFKVHFVQYVHGGGSHRGFTNAVSVPADLQSTITSVLGLDNRTLARPQTRPLRLEQVNASSELLGVQVYSAPQVAQIYNFPQATGAGQCIGIIEFGGGYNVADLVSYFSSLQLAVPDISSVSLGGSSNQPGLSAYIDSEVLLDIQISGSVVPGAKLVVYFAPGDANGYVEAFSTAVHDAANKPSVIFCTWGFAELFWMGVPNVVFELEQIFQEAAALGITICVASGDFGSTAGVFDGFAHVYYPASSPLVLSVGGTSLYSARGRIISETVWNGLASGGGASTGGVALLFPMPPHQRAANITPYPNPGTGGRGVPDVAANGNPQTGYFIYVYGNLTVSAGTSAAVPLWAALIARINQLLGTPVGYLNPLIYKTLAPRGVLLDVTQGTNGVFSARPGWDACTGWGTPDGMRLYQALSNGSVP